MDLFPHAPGERIYSSGRTLNMISGGNATVFVSNMDAAVRFYTEILELKLTNRFGDHWATIDAGKGLTIGLHPASSKYPPPGTKGGMMIGLEIDEPIEKVVSRLQKKGVRFDGPVEKDDAGSFAGFQDQDGNPIYLWEVDKTVVSEERVEYSHS
jgi:catechol 2,3-dioxygenase-like lactoylglutathione lyase family enzyme